MADINTSGGYRANKVSWLKLGLQPCKSDLGFVFLALGFFLAAEPGGGGAQAGGLMILGVVAAAGLTVTVAPSQSGAVAVRNLALGAVAASLLTTALGQPLAISGHEPVAAKTIVGIWGAGVITPAAIMIGVGVKYIYHEQIESKEPPIERFTED